jgi:hypothetical protein
MGFSFYLCAIGIGRAIILLDLDLFTTDHDLISSGIPRNFFSDYTALDINSRGECRFDYFAKRMLIIAGNPPIEFQLVTGKHWFAVKDIEYFSQGAGTGC